MPFDSIRYLAARQVELAERAELARALKRSPADIANIENMLAAVSIMLEAHTNGDTFH